MIFSRIKTQNNICPFILGINWAASSEFGSYRLCEQRRFRRASQPCSLARTSAARSYKQWVKRKASSEGSGEPHNHAVSPEPPLLAHTSSQSDRKPDPWPLWMAGHAQLKFVMTECSKTQIHLMRHNCLHVSLKNFNKHPPRDGGIKICR